MQAPGIAPIELLRPYVPRVLSAWPRGLEPPAVREVDGSMAFVDVSGFTAMSERLARNGKVGAEEVTEVIGSCFTALLGVAYAEDGSLVKFGGDALLLLFTGDDHPLRATRAASRMRRTLREIGRIETSAGGVTLRMSVGVHTGRFTFFLVGDVHHELVIAGPAASRVVEMEGAAEAGDVLLSPELAAILRPGNVGAEKGPGRLLRGTPPGVAGAISERGEVTIDLERAVPIAIREHLLAGGEDPEHRLVTVGFVHFSGTDDLAARGGPEAVRDALHGLVGIVQRAARDHGVAFLATDVDRDGGKIILTSGAPVARDDDAGRMLAAARAVVDAAPPLPVAIGVHRGHVFAGDIGPPYRRTYTVMGDAVNLAARVMTRAGSGEVLATAEVLDLARALFATEALDPFRVRGKTEPVRAFRVVEREGARGLVDGGPPLIGREHEMGVLLGALASARDGAGRVVEIVGEPGIGKSRLLAEVAGRAEGMAVLAAACEPYETATPYRPFRELLRETLGLGDDPIGDLRRVAAERAPETVPWLPLLGIPLGLEMPETAETAALEDRFRRARLEATVETLLGATLDRPALLVFEDAHWMDEASADLLTQLAEETPERPWMLCVTRRDVSDGFVAPEAPTTEVLRPAPLGADESAALLAAAGDDSPLRPDQIAVLAERAGGNPLFLGELMASARERGFDALPDSVEAAVASRIDTLAPADRALLRRLSVLGAAFDPDLAASVVGEIPWDRLAEFVERHEDGQLRFRHALIRDAAYEALPYRTREALHAQVGETLEAASEDPDDAAAVLSLHFLRARRYEPAWRYGRIAGERAASIYANVEAVALLERALEAAARIEATPADVAWVWDELGDVRHRLGGYAGATDAYRAARRLLAGEPLAEARLLLKEGQVAQRAGRLSQALRGISRARTRLGDAPGEEAARLRAECAVSYASVLQEQGRSAEAIRWCHEAIELGERSGALAVVAHASYLLDWAHVARGELDRATHSERALEIYEELGDLAGQSSVQGNLGLFAYYRGEWEVAVERYRRAQELQQRTGNATEAMLGNLNIAVVLTDQGHLAEGERLIEEALRVWRAARMAVGEGFGLAELARIVAREGRHGEVPALLDEARSIFVRIHKPPEVVMVDAVAAECALLADDVPEARSMAERALTGIASVDGAGVHAALAHRVLGVALLRSGDLGGARRHLETSLEDGRARAAEYEVALTVGALARLARAEDRPGDAEALEAESSSILERLAVLDPPAYL